MCSEVSRSSFSLPYAYPEETPSLFDQAFEDNVPYEKFEHYIYGSIDGTPTVKGFLKLPKALECLENEIISDEELIQAIGILFPNKLLQLDLSEQKIELRNAYKRFVTNHKLVVSFIPRKCDPSKETPSVLYHGFPRA